MPGRLMYDATYEQPGRFFRESETNCRRACRLALLNLPKAYSRPERGSSR